MWYLKTIKFHNFLSIEDAEINFEKLSYPLLILGINHDLGRSNGAGKTSIFNGICFGLFGRVVSTLPVSIFDNSEIVLSLFSGTDTLEITRKRTNGKEGLKFVINGDKNTGNGNTPTQTQQLLYAHFGFRKELSEKQIFQEFLTSAYFSKATVDILASNDYTPAERMELIYRMLDLSYWDCGIENATKEATLVNNQIKKNQEFIEYSRTEYNELSKIDLDKELSSKKDWGIKLTKEIENSEELCQNYRGEIEEVNKLKNELEVVNLKINNLRSNYQNNITTQLHVREQNEIAIKEAENWLKEVSVIESKDAVGIELLNIQNRLRDIDELNRKINDRKIVPLLNTRNNLSNQISALELTLKRKISELNDGLQCPSCKTELMLKNAKLELMDKGYVKEEIQTIKKNISTKEANREELAEQFKKIKKELGLLEEEKGELLNRIEISQGAEVQKNTIVIAMQKIKEIERELKIREEEHNKQLRALGNEKDSILAEIVGAKIPKGIIEIAKQEEEKLKTLQNGLLSLEKELSVLKEKQERRIKIETVIKDMRSEIKNKNAQYKKTIFWVDGFKTIKNSIVDNFIPILNTSTNEKIEKMGMNFICDIDTLRATQDGKLIQEFNIKITDSGLKTRPVVSFSDGERRTLAICIGLAMRDYKIITKLMPFGFVLFDEVFDGVDEKGQQDILEYLIKQSNDQNIIISHSDTIKDNFNSNITAVKKDNITTIFNGIRS